MKVLLITDSSFCPDTGAAGWAVAAISERSEIITGGVIERNVQTNNVAECVALANGLRAAIDAGVIKPLDEIRCLSDSLFVKDRMRPGLVGRTARRTAIRTGKPAYSLAKGSKSEIQGLLQLHQLTLTVEFIDGHGRSGKKKTPNDLLMSKVDKLSRENMNQRRNVLARQAFL